MIYLGTLGRMVGLKCPVRQQVVPAARHSFNTTLGGAVKAQVGPRGRRSWDISLGKLTTPAEVGTLMEFVDGAWGPGPFWFVPTDAPVVNLLTPAAASCDPAAIELNNPNAELMRYPPMNLGADGLAARSVWKTTDTRAAFGGPVPVIPGGPITGSVWVVGAGQILLSFFDSAGQTIRTVYSPVNNSPDVIRVALTTSAPFDAVSAQLWVTGQVTEAARPALTWTDTAYPWGDGQGCDKAVIQAASRDLVKAWNDPKTGRWSDMAFTIREVS